MDVKWSCCLGSQIFLIIIFFFNFSFNKVPLLLLTRYKNQCHDRKGAIEQWRGASTASCEQMLPAKKSNKKNSWRHNKNNNGAKWGKRATPAARSKESAAIDRRAKSGFDEQRTKRRKKPIQDGVFPLLYGRKNK